MKVMVRCALLGLLGGATALDNGLALTPAMGWNSWYDLECTPAMNETTIAARAKAMVTSGLADAGYKYVNLDDCYVSTRAPNGTLLPDPAKFPSGMRALSDAVHSLKLKFGVYTDRGTQTCAGRPAAQGHEAEDARTYAHDWQIDYLKEDSCYASKDHATAFQQYGAMRDALNATGRPVLFSLCGWNDWYAPVGASLGNSWRIGEDDTNWAGILVNIDTMAPLSKYAGPGGWNDPCLLLSKKADGTLRITELAPSRRRDFAAPATP
jgi:alpha-galactosidase